MWSTVSKALERSIKTRNVNLLLSKFWAISHVNGNIECSVELFIRKSNWFSWRRLLFIWLWNIQTIIHTTFEQFGKNWKNKNWSLVSKKKFIIFLKNTNKLIVILNFSEETASSRDALKFLKRMTYIVINIHNFRPPGWLYSPVRMRNSS